MISGTGLTKQYGGITVLNKVTVYCNSGEICGLLGANGAGKTTLFKILLGLVTPDAGNISKDTQSVKSVGGIIEKPALYDYLSAADNVRIFCGIQGLPAHKAAIQDHLQRVGLPLDRNDPVAYLLQAAHACLLIGVVRVLLLCVIGRPNGSTLHVLYN